MNRTQPGGYRVIGRRVPKVDAVDKLTGTARFSADIKASQMSIGKVLRSPHAHARIRGIDTTRAENHPGVIAVVPRGRLP